MGKAKDFYSKSVAEAIRQACAEFATSQENLDIEILETGSAGIFGLCRKRAHIRVRPKEAGEEVREQGRAPARPARPEAAPEPSRADEPQVESQGREPKPRPDSEGEGERDGEREGERGRSRGRRERKRPPRQERPADVATEGGRPPAVEEAEEPLAPPAEEVLARIQTDLARLLELMGCPGEVKVHFADNAVQCHISGEFEEQIVGPEGRTLDSLQYLLRKMLSQVLPDRMNVALDVGNFRERRMEELKKIAVELAEQVKADGRTQSIPALNPSERRVVHVALQDDKGVRSRSVGDGLFKKVLIYKPGSKVRKSGPRRRGRQGGGAEE